MTRETSAQQIKQELISAYQKDAVLIQTYFTENPNATKFKKEKLEMNFIIYEIESLILLILNQLLRENLLSLQGGRYSSFES
jgi:hypothetical protein